MCWKIRLMIALLVSTFAVQAADDEEEAPVAKSVLTEVRALIEASDYAAAYQQLLEVSPAETEAADRQNLLGYTARKLERFDQSEKHYAEALRLDPEHLDALEYQGELLVQTGRIDAAKANLAQLNRLCGNCEQAKELAEALKSVY